MRKRKIDRTLENIRYAIEIEVEFPNTKDSQKLIDRHRVIRGWAMDTDGSLENGCEYRPKDRNKLYWNEDCIDQIKEIVGLIKAHHGHIRPSCGFHVHIDSSKFTYKELINIVKAFIKEQKSIYRKFKVLKCREDYAQKIPTDTIKYLTERNIKKIKKSDNYEDSINHPYFSERHYALNILSLQKHNTLEFRMLNGSIQIRTMKKYIKWCIEFCLKNAKGKK